MRKHKGFTLVELVVVVMILGILAAVAAPKLLGTSSAATDNSLKASLGVVRDAIERYAADNGGALPTDLAEDLKPYIRVFPKSPLIADPTAAVTVRVVSAAGDLEADGTEAWAYNSTTGQFICNSGDATKSTPSVTYDKL